MPNGENPLTVVTCGRDSDLYTVTSVRALCVADGEGGEVSTQYRHSQGKFEINCLLP